MNAKWMPILGAAAGAMTVAVGLFSTTSAAPPGATRSAMAAVGQSPAPAPLTRDQVDQLLSQARSAIADGNLDRAAALVERAESAHVRYPMFHLGPTPASVRRELSYAQRAERGDAHSASMPNPFGSRGRDDTRRSHDSGATQAADPFAERPLALPAEPLSQPVPPSMDGGMTPPVVPALHSQPVGVPDRAVQRASAAAYESDTSPSTAAMQFPQQLGTADGSHDSWPTLAPPGQAVPMPSDFVSAAADDQPPTTQKARALELLRTARQALVAGDLDAAEQAARRAGELGVPESAFLPHEDRPSLLAWDLHRAQAAGENAVPATDAQSMPDDRYAAQTRLVQEHDLSRNIRAATAPPTITDMQLAQLPEPLDLPPEDEDFDLRDEALPAPTARPLAPSSAQRMSEPKSQSAGESAVQSTGNSSSAPSAKATAAESEAGQLLLAGETALNRRDRQAAASLFGQAYVLRDELDRSQQERLREHLQMLAATNETAAPRALGSTLLDSAADSEQALARQISAEVGKKQSEARRLREKNPQQAIKLLQDTRQQVTDSQLSGEFRTQLLRRIDITLDETEKYFRDHRAEIELDQKNQAVLDEVKRNREVKLKVQDKIAELVNEFNRLRDEQRYAEMEIVARRLIELAPDEPVAQQVWQNAKFIRRTIMNQQLADRREDGYWNQLNDVENSSVPNVGDGREMAFDQKHWEKFVKNRKGAGDRDARRTERELEIERRLKTPVMLRYEETPLSEVMQGLSQLAGINIHLDPRGLTQEGWESSTPVTINLSKEISLKSALNLILEPLHLSYVIHDEVLKVTSEQLRDGQTWAKVYNVADLVIPIPNFVPNNNIGLQGLINDAHARMGYGQGGIGMPGPTVLVNERGPGGRSAAGKENVLAQQFGGGAGGSPSSSIPLGSGPGGLGGGANADFDSLIDLIVSTVASETWAENGGGEAEIRPFPTNLSLVISQTQAVHEEIADLLEQLRRLQDLQVTIEVRFIRLNDSFFERIGIDFDMNIEDGTNNFDLTAGSSFEPRRQSSIVGLQFPAAPQAPFPNFTTDLDVPFRQGSFDLTSPIFGGAPLGSINSFGFAILSDIEAYFLIEAAQGDRRTNVLNAPKVTLFNGQQAFVADAVSRPFVIGVIPVVGEFAAAQQPVIVVLNEGTMMSIQAVVSNDRRYVRLTVVPFFTEIGDVQEFTFEGTSSTSSSSSTTDDDGDGQDNMSDEMQSNARSGVTVQLPAFQFVAVVTTVSVPDGGTVLLGGIKRLSEGRNEVGVPLLSKLPYINRLFRNVGIGRETDSLMMMVTPRIIIQEEEEERLGITVP